jgi:hypothetical protein
VIEALAQFAPSATDGISVRMNALAKLLFSSTLAKPRAGKNARPVKRAAVDEIKALKQQPGDPLRPIGSISPVKSMMQLRLADHLRRMLFPPSPWQRGQGANLFRLSSSRPQAHRYEGS